MTAVSTTPQVAAVAAPTTTRRGLGRTLMLGLPPLAVLAVLLTAWYVISLILEAKDLGYLLPLPHRVFTEGLFKAGVAGDIGIALLRTTGVALIGLAVAIVIGVVWAIGMSMARWVERSLYSYAVILQCVPILALVPLIGFWFGFDFFARMIVCVLIALFPMVSNTLFGLKSVDRSHRELFQLQKANKWTVLTKLTFPAALPSIFVGMRTSAGLAVIGAIVGDYFFRRGNPGIGSLISNYQSRLQSPQLFSAILSACLLGVLIFAVFGWIAKLAVGRWYEPAN